jgi:hypothetical protein
MCVILQHIRPSISVNNNNNIKTKPQSMKRQAGLGASATPCRNPLPSFGWSLHQVFQPK